MFLWKTFTRSHLMCLPLMYKAVKCVYKYITVLIILIIYKSKPSEQLRGEDGETFLFRSAVFSYKSVFCYCCLVVVCFFYTEKAFKEALKTSAGTCGRVGENKTGIERRKTTTKALQPWRSMS